MEGPGTIWIPRLSSTAGLPYLVAHEIAHQWLYGLVGNDQWGDPFADEAMADMISRYVVNQHRASRCDDDRLDLPITSYSQECYYEVVYIQGGNWLSGLRELMGDSVYWAALRGYLDAHRFGLSDTRTMLDALDVATPLDIAFLAAPLFPSRYAPTP
jgi:aminopeptidase N